MHQLAKQMPIPAGIAHTGRYFSHPRYKVVQNAFLSNLFEIDSQLVAFHLDDYALAERIVLNDIAHRKASSVVFGTMPDRG